MFSLAELTLLVGEIEISSLAKLISIICYDFILGVCFLSSGENGTSSLMRWTLSLEAF